MSMTTPPGLNPPTSPSQPYSTSRSASADGRTVMMMSQPCAIIFGEPLIMPPTSLVNIRTAISTTS
jgi:hypothetical protein